MSRAFSTKENEEIIHIVRQSMLVRIPATVLGIICVIGPFFFFFPIFGIGPLGVAIFIICVGFGLWLLGRQAIMWRGNMWIITTERLIELKQNGYFNRERSEAIWKAVSDIAYRRSGLSAVLGLGSVRVRFHGVIPPIIVSPVGSPKKLYNLLVEVKALPTHVPSSQSTFVRRHIS